MVLGTKNQHHNIPNWPKCSNFQMLNTSILQFNPNTQVLGCDLSWGLDNSYKPCGIFAPISWHYVVAYSTHQTYMVRLKLDGTNEGHRLSNH